MGTENIALRKSPSHSVEPLGVFGVLAGQKKFQRQRGDLNALRDQLSYGERPLIAAYLRSGAVAFAIMEYTRDALANAFGVPGGSALLTDGTYYWRADAAEYVERYGIGLPEQFLLHGRALNWSVPSVSESDLLDIYHYLEKHVRLLPDDK